ncbi:MAG: choice-of-anchor Q domain-containing protein [Methylocella sp.]
MSSLFGVILVYSGVIGDTAAASGIIYAKNPVIYTLGRTITSNTASCKGTLSKVSITPALPDGTTINPTSGAISGLPTQIVASTAYTVSAKCSAAPVTGVLTLGIGDALTAYYVDSVNGNDSADGHTPGTAWKTAKQVNNASLGPNTSVRFKRGGVWREQLKLQSGSAAGAIYYDAYGTGPKPALMGSVSANLPSNWTALGGNLWQSVATFAPQPGYTNGLPYGNANDVGNFLWGGHTNPGIGIEMWAQSALKKPADWFFRTSDWRVVVYATQNPATEFPGLELAINRDLVEMNHDGESYAYLQNVSLLYTAGNGTGGNGVLTSHVTFRDLEISYIGGGNLGGKGIRYGNGIQFWGNAHDNVVERNRIWQIYDTGLTNQSFGTNIVVHDITYRNNVLWNMNESFEIWLHPSDSGTGSTMHDIYVLNNTAVNPGGWGANQRPNGPQGFALNIGTPASVAVSNIVFENNAFTYFPSTAIVEDQSFNMWQGEMTVDYNEWFHLGLIQVGEFVPRLLGEPFAQWAANFPAEQHGIEADPLFVNLATGDFHLSAGSPLIRRGANLGKRVVLDFDRKPRPATGAFDIGAYQSTSTH